MSRLTLLLMNLQNILVTHDIFLILVSFYRRKARAHVNAKRRDSRVTGSGPPTVPDVGEATLGMIGALGAREFPAEFDSISSKS